MPGRLFHPFPNGIPATCGPSGILQRQTVVRHTRKCLSPWFSYDIFSLRFSEQVHPALSPVSFLHLKCLVDGPHFRFSINTSQTFADNPFPSRDVNPSWNRWNDLFPTISYQSQNAGTVWDILPGNRRNFPSSGRHPGREFRISLKTYTFSPATSRIINIC